MGEISTLLTQHSIEELVILIVLILFALKALNELVAYFYSKIKQHFGIKSNEEEWEKGVSKNFDKVFEEIEYLKKQNSQTHKHQKQLDTGLALVQERLQENTRSYLINAHHRFCYEIHAIDDLSLQAMERRYLYYKTAGGDSFIDNLMDEVRSLPKINFYTSMLDEDHNGTDDRRE